MTRTFIAIPSIGICDTRFAISLAALKKPVGTAIAASSRSMPDVARNGLFDQAVKFLYDYVFFLDDDMILDANALVSLQEKMDKDVSIDALSLLAFRRHPPFLPCVMQKAGDGYEPIEELEGEIVHVDAMHFAATMVRVSSLQKVAAPRFQFKHEDTISGEDLVLSKKMKALNLRLCCDLSLPEALHIGLPPLIGRKAFEGSRRQESRLIVP
jgi:hypothetical protein